MSTDEEREYPQCPSRLTSADRHPTCNDPTKCSFQRPVRPEDCRRCPGAEMTLPEAVAPEPVPPQLPPPRWAARPRRAARVTRAATRRAGSHTPRLLLRRGPYPMDGGRSAGAPGQGSRADIQRTLQDLQMV